jgi:hypothetical protein
MDRSERHGAARIRRASGTILSGISITGIIIAFIAVVLLGTVAMVGSGYFKTETTTTTVLDKERVCDSDGDNGVTCEYLIFTEAGTFKLTDSIFAGRWSSSDAYGRVKRCHRYEIDSYGWRLPFFSAYPNIKEMEDLGRDEGCEP